MKKNGIKIIMKKKTRHKSRNEKKFSIKVAMKKNGIKVSMKKKFGIKVAMKIKNSAKKSQ